MRELRTLRQEDGAEMVEMALILPLLLLVVFGLIYSILAASAQVSLVHATSVGARYASIATDSVVTAYPDAEQVREKVTSSTPFFGDDACDTQVTGDEVQNAKLVLEVSCAFPNPLGRAINGMLVAVTGERAEPGQPGPFGDTLLLTARATARRE